ncbi:KIRREL3 [Branchiostoma lanceolatum]|uniref:KIRREL3 protein n=1 Tax=Branchiostoma lanceolatum TaxID=7740 RepID=A0A8K0EYM0_BRALA|nr:KIRREL3 [Branchiostoma lanceolatum]
MPPVPKSVKRLGHGTNDSGVEDLELQELAGTLKPRPPPRAGKQWTPAWLMPPRCLGTQPWSVPSPPGLDHAAALPWYAAVGVPSPPGLAHAAALPWYAAVERSESPRPGSCRRAALVRSRGAFRVPQAWLMPPRCLGTQPWSVPSPPGLAHAAALPWYAAVERSESPRPSSCRRAALVRSRGALRVPQAWLMPPRCLGTQPWAFRVPKAGLMPPRCLGTHAQPWSEIDRTLQREIKREGTRHPRDRTPEGPDTRGTRHPRDQTPEGPGTRGTGHPRDRPPEGPGTRGTRNPRDQEPEGPDTRGNAAHLPRNVGAPGKGLAVGHKSCQVWNISAREGGGVVEAWWRRGFQFVICGQGMVEAWWRRGGGVVEAWLRRGFRSVLCGQGRVEAWGRRGGGVGEGWVPVCALWARDGGGVVEAWLRRGFRSVLCGQGRVEAWGRRGGGVGEAWGRRGFRYVLCGQGRGEAWGRPNAAVYRVRPQPTAVLHGQTAVLRCAFDQLTEEELVIWDGPDFKVISYGRKVLHVYNRHHIVGDIASGEFNLEIRRTQLEDDGKYSCYTDPKAAASAVLTVVVPMPTPPTIAGGELTATAGEQLTLTCRASGGHPAARLTWLNGTRSLSTASVTTTTEEDQTLDLFLPRLTKWDNGANFTCLADQGFPQLARTKASSRILRVKYPPVVQVPSPSVHVREGEPASLSCMVDSNPKADVTWRKFGGSLPSLKMSREHVLHLPKVSKEDGGMYQCEADNGVPPHGLGTINLQVYHGPIMDSTMEDEVTMLYGQDDQSVHCVVTGNPKPHIRWRRKDTSLYWGNPLRFHRVRYDVQGTYQCVAANDGFREVTKDVFIDVVGKPAIGSGPTTVAVVDGGTARLRCEILGDPLPGRVTWFWRNNKGVENVVMATDYGLSIIEKPTNDGTSSTVLLKDVGISEEGTYVCQAANMFGEARREIRLEVTGTSGSLVVIIISMVTAALGLVGAVIVCVALKKRWICGEQKHDRSTLSSTRSMPPVPKSVKRLGHGTNDSGVEDLELQELDGTLKPRPPPRAGKEWTSVGLSYTGASVGLSYTGASVGLSYTGASVGLSYTGASVGLSYTGASVGLSYTGTSVGLSYTGASVGLSYTGASVGLSYTGTSVGLSYTGASVGLSYTGLAQVNVLPPYATVERHRPDGQDIRSRDDIPEEAAMDTEYTEHLAMEAPTPPPKDNLRRWRARAPPGGLSVRSSMLEAENDLNEIEAENI